MKLRWMMSVLLSGLVCSPGCMTGAQMQEESAGERAEDARIRIGYDISPVPVDMRERDEELVGLGSYLVNALGGCNDCHTYPSYAEGGNPYLGEPTVINSDQYMAGGRQLDTPMGTVTAPNITPDDSGRPAGIRFEDFETLMRTGREPHHPDELMQVMPWPLYAEMTDRDLRAIYEYLRAIPSLPDNPNPGP